MDVQSALIYHMWDSHASLDKRGDINTCNSDVLENIH